jgi:hypothetical protein
LYLLYGILLTIGIGYFTQQNPISCTGIGLMVLYLCTVTTQYRNLSKKISQATATVEFSGSKWSFANPLRVQIPREFG